ncbi:MULTISPECIES: TolC family protein [Prochlorococcus]|uniref:TolC family protein n=1 Tax=Prochlorococcus TaxID=1218 RepID=UPI0007B329A0|nr:TolC family protein [Prochlorococcus marinus]NMO83933.1 TolC family protein [Prochlorococcus sp. P1344]NMP05621.1 TolC family protein [Prochlorococcus sp. P1361]NMP12712.1 TolC family protein [Prochlorococcus sp.P1363]KZR67343.1 outer membrane channel protein [Prochlorococcus marinus str. MIT 1312]KZR83958.1 outer membrane channel protein [Prochlorococcus marinus str. MIT 1327]
MRLITARLFLLAGVLAQGCTGVRAQQSLEVQQHGSSTDQAPASLEAEADGSALIDQSTLPSSIELKGSRPRVDPSVVKPAATSLPETLSSLGAPPSLALPNKTSEVRIRELRPLSLSEVEQLAEVNSPTLKAAASQVEQAKSNLLAALSTWYPTLNLSSSVDFKGSESRTNPENHQLIAEEYTFGEEWITNFGATVKWKLIDPARVPQIASARDSFEKQRDTYLIALRDLRLNAADVYFQLQRADEGVGIGQNAVRASLVSLRDAQSRLQAGVATKLEVLEAETQLARDTQSLNLALAQQNTRRRDLAQLLDLPQDVTPTAADPVQIIGIWQPSLEESIVAAYAFREELDSLILDISINNSNANAALAAVQPVISLSNTYQATRGEGQGSVALGSSVDWKQHQWSSNNTVGLGFSWNIFDGGRAWAQYRQNKQKAQQSEFEFAAKRDQVRLEVEQSFFNLGASSQDIRTTSIGVLSSRESLRLARLRFQAGVTTQREVVNNQRDLKQAKTLYADAMLKYNRSMIELSRRTGLDQIAACDSLELSNKKPKDDLFDSDEIPIKPSPLTPACKASILQAE